MAPSILHPFFFLRSSRPCPILLHLKPYFFTSQAPFLYISSSVPLHLKPRSFFISIWLLFCVIASFLHHNTFSFSPPFPLILTTFPSHSHHLSLLFFPSFPLILPLFSFSSSLFGNVCLYSSSLYFYYLCGAKIS